MKKPAKTSPSAVFFVKLSTRRADDIQEATDKEDFMLCGISGFYS